jgi:hypothetical protein
MPNDLEVLIVHEMEDVPLCPGKVIVQAEDRMAFQKQPLAKVRAQKTGSTGNKNSCPVIEVESHDGISFHPL